jgi:hypothetical protein
MKNMEKTKRRNKELFGCDNMEEIHKETAKKIDLRRYQYRFIIGV